jgi:hypothetical protein
MSDYRNLAREPNIPHSFGNPRSGQFVKSWESSSLKRCIRHLGASPKCRGRCEANCFPSLFMNTVRHCWMEPYLREGMSCRLAAPLPFPLRGSVRKGILVAPCSVSRCQQSGTTGACDEASKSPTSSDKVFAQLSGGERAGWIAAVDQVTKHKSGRFC